MSEYAQAGKHNFCEKPIVLDKQIIRNALVKLTNPESNSRWNLNAVLIPIFLQYSNR